LPCFIFHIIKPRLNQTRVADHHLNAGMELPLVPSLPQFRSHFRGKDGNMDTFLSQDSLQAPCHIPFLGIDCVDLHLPATLKRGFDFLHQPPFLGVNEVLIQVRCGGDQKRLTTLRFGIEFPPDQVSEAEQPVRVSKQSIQRHADHRLVASMLAECLLDVLFQVLVRFLQRFVHVDAEHFLPIGRESIGNILQRHEGAKTHQEAAKQQR